MSIVEIYRSAYSSCVMVSDILALIRTSSAPEATVAVQSYCVFLHALRNGYITMTRSSGIN